MTAITSSRYLDELTQLKCAPDLLASDLKLFPNAKEVTESFAAFNAVHKYLCHWLSKPATVVVVGDGARPRTGATFAYRSKWNVISIDPNMKLRASYDKMQRLHCYQDYVESFEPRHYARVLIVAVHAHTPLESALHRFRADERAAVAMPCCQKQTAWREPDYDYEDYGCLSPRRRVRVWSEV